MSARSLVERGRRRAEELMVDTCTIRRLIGQVVDDNTGDSTDVWETLYEGPCQVQQRPATATPETPGQDYQLLVDVKLHLPLSVTDLQVDDEVTINAAAIDPALVGMVFHVKGLFAKSFPTSRRVGVTRRTD